MSNHRCHIHGAYEADRNTVNCPKCYAVEQAGLNLTDRNNRITALEAENAKLTAERDKAEDAVINQGGKMPVALAMIKRVMNMERHHRDERDAARAEVERLKQAGRAVFHQFTQAIHGGVMDAQAMHHATLLGECHFAAFDDDDGGGDS